MTDMDWRTKVFIAGGLIGAALGLSAAYLYVTAIEKEGVEPDLRPGAAVAIGLSLLGLLRQIATLPEAEAASGK